MARYTIVFALFLAALAHAAPIALNPPCHGEDCESSRVVARYGGNYDYPVAEPPSGNTGGSVTGAPVPVSTPVAENPAPSSAPSAPSTPSTPSNPTPEEGECEEGEEEPEVPSPTGSIPTQPETPAPSTPPTQPETPPTKPETPSAPTTPTTPETPEQPEPSTPSGNTGGGFLRQNGEQAQKENTEFASLTKDSPCTDGDSACVEGSFAQCIGGKWVLQQCANGLTCAALPLVNKQGTSVTCTTEADRDARITAALQG